MHICVVGDLATLQSASAVQNYLLWKVTRKSQRRLWLLLLFSLLKILIFVPAEELM
jgi:hypothetical protein